MIPTDTELADIAVAVGRYCIEREATITTAESCTGGWVAKLVTDVAGSSHWFQAGYVTYSDAAKVRMLGVSKSLLLKHGAVSEPVVVEMAEGARREAGAKLSVAVSGIAGPGGGSIAKPVGTVWLAWSSSSATSTRKRQFAGDRDAVRRHAAAEALTGLLDMLRDDA
jgi:nicotinamide-nucleotide amidase